MKHLKASLLFAVYIFCIALKVEASAHDEIDEYLQEKVQSDSDMDGIFAAAEEYRDKLSQQKFLFPSKRIQLLEQMLALRDSLKVCSLDSFKLFEKTLYKWWNDASWTGRSRAGVSKATIEHADYCLDEILELKNKQLSELDQTDVSRVREYTTISTSIGLKTENMKFLHGKLVQEEIDLLFDSTTIRKLANLVLREHENNPNQSGEKLSGKDMCQKYIVSSCQRYVSKLSEVFELWSWSKTRAHETIYLKKYDEMKEDFIAYQVCKYTIHRPRDTFRDVAKRLDEGWY